MFRQKPNQSPLLKYLRRSAESTPVAAPTPAAPAKREIAAMNAGELSGLDVAMLSVDELEEAMRAAIKIDAGTGGCVCSGWGCQTVRPNQTGSLPALRRSDHRGIIDGDLAKAVELVEQGEKYDAEHNASGRTVEFSLKKAQLFVKMKDADKAADALDAIIAKHPDEGKFYTIAAEDMLRRRERSTLYFAERGLAKARETSNRDLAGHCEELIGAAKRCCEVVLFGKALTPQSHLPRGDGIGE